MLGDRRILAIIIVIVLIIVLWWAVDHLFFPTLPMPEGAQPITR